MNEALNRSSPPNVSMCAGSAEHVQEQEQFFLSLCSERSEVSGCVQQPSCRRARSVSCFRGSIAFDGLRESMLQYLDVDSVGYRVKGKRFAHDERDVTSGHDYLWTRPTQVSRPQIFHICHFRSLWIIEAASVHSLQTTESEKVHYLEFTMRFLWGM